MDPELRNQIEDLYSQRKVNKSRTDVSLDPFRAFLESVRHLESPAKAKPAVDLELLREEANGEFLKAVSMGLGAVRGGDQ